MKLHLHSGDDLNLIKAYTAAEIVIGDEVFHSSLMLTPERIIPEWSPRAVMDLAEADFAAMCELRPEVVLLGTGARMVFPAAAVTQPLLRGSIGLEVMDTQAACRTYNILAGEGRKVLAALIIEPAP